jgi:RND family efflux transporter MFP subunit
MKKIILCTAMIALILLTSCQQGSDSEIQSKVPVSVTEIVRGNVNRTLSFNGDIQARVEVKVFSKIPDRIAAFFADEGDRVAAGTVIAEIASTQIEQAVKQAEAAVSAASAQQNNMEAEYRRAERLKQEDAMSQQQFELISTQYKAALAQYEQAQAALKTAQSQYQDTKISAPISGIIGKRYYEAGDMANPGMPIVTIVQMEQVKILFNVPEKEMPLLSKGQSAKIQVIGIPDQNFYGTVTKISPVLDPLTRMADVEVDLDNPSYLLRPGMYATLEITVGVIENVLVVPRYAVLENSSLKKIDGKDTVVRNYFVYVVHDSLAEQRQLDVMYVNHRSIAVNDGIIEGDTLVISGQNNLRNGLPVLIIEEEEK